MDFGKGMLKWVSQLGVLKKEVVTDHLQLIEYHNTINTKVLIRVPDFHVLLSVGGSSVCLLLTSNRIRMTGSVRSVWQ